MRTISLLLELRGLPKLLLSRLSFGTGSVSAGSSTSRNETQTTLSDHVGQIQGFYLPQLRWLTNLYGHLLGKDQKRLSVPTRESCQLGSLPEATASGPLRVWPRCNSKQGDYDLILLRRPKTFYPGPVGCTRLGTGLLGGGYWESY